MLLAYSRIRLPHFIHKINPITHLSLTLKPTIHFAQQRRNRQYKKQEHPIQKIQSHQTKPTQQTFENAQHQLMALCEQIIKYGKDDILFQIQKLKILKKKVELKNSQFSQAEKNMLQNMMYSLDVENLQIVNQQDLQLLIDLYFSLLQMKTFKNIKNIQFNSHNSAIQRLLDNAGNLTLQQLTIYYVKYSKFQYSSLNKHQLLAQAILQKANLYNQSVYLSVQVILNIITGYKNRKFKSNYQIQLISKILINFQINFFKHQPKDRANITLALSYLNLQEQLRMSQKYQDNIYKHLYSDIQNANIPIWQDSICKLINSKAKSQSLEAIRYIILNKTLECINEEGNVNGDGGRTKIIQIITGYSFKLTDEQSNRMAKFIEKQLQKQQNKDIQIMLGYLIDQNIFGKNSINNEMIIKLVEIIKQHQIQPCLLLSLSRKKIVLKQTLFNTFDQKQISQLTDEEMLKHYQKLFNLMMAAQLQLNLHNSSQLYKRISVFLFDLFLSQAQGINSFKLLQFLIRFPQKYLCQIGKTLNFLQIADAIYSNIDELSYNKVSSCQYLYMKIYPLQFPIYNRQHIHNMIAHSVLSGIIQLEIKANRNDRIMNCQLMKAVKQIVKVSVSHLNDHQKINSLMKNTFNQCMDYLNEVIICLAENYQLHCQKYYFQLFWQTLQDLISNYSIFQFHKGAYHQCSTILITLLSPRIRKCSKFVNCAQYYKILQLCPNILKLVQNDQLVAELIKMNIYLKINIDTSKYVNRLSKISDKQLVNQQINEIVYFLNQKQDQQFKNVRQNTIIRLMDRKNQLTTDQLSQIAKQAKTRNQLQFYYILLLWYSHPNSNIFIQILASFARICNGQQLFQINFKQIVAKIIFMKKNNNLDLKQNSQIIIWLQNSVKLFCDNIQNLSFPTHFENITNLSQLNIDCREYKTALINRICGIRSDQNLIWVKVDLIQQIIISGISLTNQQIKIILERGINKAGLYAINIFLFLEKQMQQPMKQEYVKAVLCQPNVDNNFNSKLSLKINNEFVHNYFKSYYQQYYINSQFDTRRDLLYPRCGYFVKHNHKISTIIKKISSWLNMKLQMKSVKQDIYYIIGKYALFLLQPSMNISKHQMDLLKKILSVECKQKIIIIEYQGEWWSKLLWKLKQIQPTILSNHSAQSIKQFNYSLFNSKHQQHSKKQPVKIKWVKKEKK